MMLALLLKQILLLHVMKLEKQLKLVFYLMSCLESKTFGLLSYTARI